MRILIPPWPYSQLLLTGGKNPALNLLTTAVVKAASSEIETGRHVQLDWPLEALKFPGFGRRTMNQKLIDSSESLNEYALDDELHLNTQSGSQWDSLKHVRRHGDL
jgi:hypothetical protein